jgi:Phage integrase family
VPSSRKRTVKSRSCTRFWPGQVSGSAKPWLLRPSTFQRISERSPGTFQSPKAKIARRQVDLCPALAELLKTFVGDRQSGLVFANRAGKALSQTNVVRRSLHPILKELGAEQTGFHAMRRFRTTWLRKQRAPEDLIGFWLGHAKQSVTDGYSKLEEEREFRTQVAQNDKTIVVTRCGRICPGRKKINFSQVFAGQGVGVKEVHDDIWLVIFMDYDLGYFDLETRVLEPLENPFGPKVLPM